MLIVAIRITRLYIYLLRDLFVCVELQGAHHFWAPLPWSPGNRRDQSWNSPVDTATSEQPTLGRHGFPWSHMGFPNAIFYGDVALHRPYIGLIYGTSNLGSWKSLWFISMFCSSSAASNRLCHSWSDLYRTSWSFRTNHPRGLLAFRIHGSMRNTMAFWMVLVSNDELIPFKC